MIFGYIRVSTVSQNIDRQKDALEKAGAERLFIDKVTGTKADRPQLNEMFKQLRKGDIVIVTELSRFGRSLKDLLKLVEELDNMGVEFKSLKETIDTTTPYGKFFFAVNCAYAQLQRDIIVQNTEEGLKAARARGRKGGRPPADEKNIQTALKMYNSKEYSIKEITNITGISQGTLYKYIKNQKGE